MINWKIRFKNPLFLVQLGLSIGLPILGYYGMTAQELTTWQSVLDLIVKAISNPYVVGTIAISLWNAVNDPTTKGVSDSHQAMNYKEPK